MRLSDVVNQEFLTELDNELDCFVCSISGGEMWAFPFEAARKCKRLLLEYKVSYIEDVTDDEIINSITHQDFKELSHICYLMDDDMLIQFQDMWNFVKYPEGETPLSMAVIAWARSPDAVLIDIGLPTEKSIDLGNAIAAIAKYLAEKDKDGIFYMASRSLETILKHYGLNYSHATISTVKRKFVEWGYFEVTKNKTTTKSHDYRLTKQFYRSISQTRE